MEREERLRRRRELYRLSRDAETAEQREVRLAARRERERRGRATMTPEDRQALTVPTNTPWTVADEDATSCEMSIPSASSVISTSQLPRDTLNSIYSAATNFHVMQQLRLAPRC